MNSASPLEQISDRIKGSEGGTVFVASDFRDIANSGSISKTLSRLEEDGLIRRVIWGVYEYPKYSTFLNENVATSPHKVALALARKHSWSIVPNGDTALNQLGLSTQVPAEWTYVSDGTNKEYPMDNTIIRFNRTVKKDISNLPYKTALLVQAIKAIGRNRLDDAYMRRIAKLMTAEEKTAILQDGKYMTAWVYEAVKKICNGVSAT